MREYSKVGPQFWNGKTGKALKAKGSEAVIVGLYLMTCQHANMLGLYYLNKVYIAADTGLTLEGASKGLQSACEVGFCSYDEESEVVWVTEMALYQIADQLEAKDNRCKGIQREYDSLPENPFLTPFYERYAPAFHMTSCRGCGEESARGSKAPSKPLRSQEQEQEQKKEPNGSVASGDLPACKTQAMVDLYHEVLPELPAVRLLNDPRKKALSKLWKWILTSAKPDGERRAHNGDEALSWLREYFGRARENDFLMGRTGRSGEHANWQCDLDFLLTDKGMKHVIEKTKEPA